MPRPFKPKVVTGNTLMEGHVVWLTAQGDWTTRMSEAEFIEDQAHAELRLLHAEALAHEVVGPYLADAQMGPNGPEPTHFRESFRRDGPSAAALPS